MIIHFEQTKTVTNSARKAAEIIIRKDNEMDAVASAIMQNIKPDKQLQAREHYKSPLEQLVKERYEIAAKILAARLEVNANTDEAAKKIVKELVKQYTNRMLNVQLGYISGRTSASYRRGRVIKYNAPEIEYDYDRYKDGIEAETLEPEGEAIII